MLDWLKRIATGFGTGAALENRAGISADEVKLLAEDFQSLDKLKSGLAERLVRYVLDGEGAGVLLELRGLKGASDALGLRVRMHASYKVEPRPRWRFFQQCACPDPRLWLRLACAYDAASQQSARDLRCAALAGGNEWVEVFLREATQIEFNVWPTRFRAPAVPIETLEAMLVADGRPADLLVRGPLMLDFKRWGYAAPMPMFTSLKGFRDAVVRHRHVIVEAFGQSDFKQRLHALNLLIEREVPANAFAEELAAMAVDSSKQAREAAGALLATIPDQGLPLLQQKAAGGTPEERGHAARLLWKIAGESVRPFLESRLADESSKKVGQVIRDLLAAEKAPREAAAEFRIELPALPEVPVRAPLPESTLAALQACIAACNADAEATRARLEANSQGKFRGPKFERVSEKQVDLGFEWLQTLVIPKRKIEIFRFFYGVADKHVKTFLQLAELNLIHAVRFLVLMDRIDPWSDRFVHRIGWGSEALLRHYRRHHPPAFSLRDLANVFRTIGIDDGAIGRAMLECWTRLPFDWGAEVVWPYFAEHLDLLEEALEARPTGRRMEDYLRPQRRRHAFEILAMFPQPPPAFVGLLWDVALGSSKTERPMAQRCLDSQPGKEAKIIAALGSGQQETRAVAADWIAKLRLVAAVPSLMEALKKEKSEVAKGAIMSSLEALDVPIDQFLDRAGLLEAAERGLAKGTPESLAWFPFDLLPPVCWEDTGQVVPRDVLKWFIVQGCRLKSPEPGPLLRRYCSHFRRAEREALGQFVLESWIAQDTLPAHTHETAAPLAEQQARQMASYYSDLTHEQLYPRCLNGLLAQCKGSSIDEKGVLAVAAACCGPRMAPAVARYLKQWYGYRAAQCKAMIQMLAWAEHPTATQLLLSVGNRFRTKGIREEADRQVEALAERKGWTRDELADRTIPTAGFDENCEMEIDYGPRQFRARLSPDFQVVVVNTEGRELSALPDARKDEDEDQVKVAKKTLSAAKKELGSVLQLQRERMYEAMCTQRTWKFSAWETYLNRHPIVRRYCQSLVWSVADGGMPARTFRPLDDGTLTDAADEAVTVEPEAAVRLAHDCNTTEDLRKAWARHFSDYNVVPLFTQFGKERLTLADDKKEDTEIADFEGHLIEAFKLRGRATKLGYTRGQAEDGGWFYVYRKNFPTLGLEAVIEFTGNGLPEENRTVALRDLHFVRRATGGEAGGEDRIALGDLPPVLVSECWNDLRNVASEGTGHDPDWEKKVQF